MTEIPHPQYLKREKLLKQWQRVRQLADLSKLGRLLSLPWKYSNVMIFRHFVYPLTKRERILEVPVFFGAKMKIGLPSATDIYLTGGRSHVSEIKFAQYLIRRLEEGATMMDIGAHYGYFSLLAAEIVGVNGKILSFEPSPKTYALLRENVKSYPMITAVNNAMSDKAGDFTIYEFPNLYSEYNTYNPKPFEREKWYRNFPPQAVLIPATTIDNVTKQLDFSPSIIKMDAEGSEYQILKGGQQFISKSKPIIAMRFWQAYRQNEMHLKALSMLKEIGYQSFHTTIEGNLESLEDPSAYLLQQNIESDTIIFKSLE